VVMKLAPKGGIIDQQAFVVEFKHESQHTRTYARENLLLSQEYKRAQDNYYKEEIQEFLDRLDQEEGLIAQALADQDHRGEDMVRRQLDFGGQEEGLRIGNADLDEEKDEELLEINRALQEDESRDMANLSSLLSGGI